MAERRFPRPDADFAAYMDHYVGAVEQWWEAHGLDTDDLKDLHKALEAWNQRYPEHIAARNAAEAARAAKDGARSSLEQAARPVTALIQGFPATTNAERATIGITIRDRSAAPYPAPATFPVVSINRTQRLMHTLSIADSATPLRTQRPRGTLGAEVWVALAAPGDGPPEDRAAYRFLRTTTSTPFDATFGLAEAGQTAAYMLRWVSTTGEPGPWSAVAAATVAA